MVLCPNTWSQRWVRLWRPLGAREPAARGGAIFLTREAREPSGRAQAASSAASAPARQPWQLSFKMFQGKTKIVPRASTIFICHDSWVATSFSPSMRHSTIHRTFWIFSCSKLFFPESSISWIQLLKRKSSTVKITSNDYEVNSLSNSPEKTRCSTFHIFPGLQWCFH